MAKKQKTLLKRVMYEDLTKQFPMSETIRSISKRLNAGLKEGRKRSKVIGHSLAYGLAAEKVVRSLIREMMPLKYGVGKGRILNRHGKTTRLLDVIIYDALNCPTFFVDEDKSQVFPLESVCAVIQVKVRTTSSMLKDAFENLASVAAIAGDAPNCSTNEEHEYRPPLLSVLSFQDSRKLETIRDNYIELSQSFPRSYSFSRYSSKSPNFKDNTGEFHLVSSIFIIGKGEVYHMLDGRVGIGRWGVNSFGIFIMALYSELSRLKLPSFIPEWYLSWFQSGIREVYERTS